jgi:AraC family transcriptional regulator
METSGTVLLSERAVNNPLCARRETAGRAVKRRDLHGFNVIESAYPSGLVLSRHTHARSYFSFVLEGAYTETLDGCTEACAPGTLRFLPADEVHENSYTAGARCLLVEIEPQTFAALAEHATVIEQPGEVKSPKAVWLARRLYSEFNEPDNVAPLAIECVVLELIAEQTRSASKSSPKLAPRWLQRARDLIQARFLEVPSLSEIAGEAGVHPVHLSREFRRFYDCTVSDFMRKLRIEHASRLLADTDTPLSEIALLCGFADQSHFSAVFKREVGVTPSRFRDMSSRQLMTMPLS